MASKDGFSTTYGVELNKLEAEVAEKRGHKIFREEISKIHFPETFDLISMWDVFEHIKDGKDFLTGLKSKLSNHGLVLLQIPTSAALAARIMQEKCNMFDGLEHVNLYSPENVREIAKKTGYEVLEMVSVIPEIPVMDNYLRYEDPYRGERKAQNELLSILDENTILENLLGYKLQIILRSS